MSSTTVFLRSRSTSPENYEEAESKPFDRYLRRDGQESRAEKMRYLRRFSRTRSILACVALFALLGLVITNGPFKKTYQHGKCKAAIFIADIPASSNASQSDWVNLESLNGGHIPSLEDISHWAKIIHPDELLDMLERGNVSDAKIIHQSWKNRHDLPSNFNRWSREWRRLHGADWKYVFWTDEDNLKLVQKYYPEYLQTYMDLPKEIYRADMVRNMYMHRFGGIYADLDLIPLSSLTEHLPILNSTTPAPIRIAYVGRMSVPTFEHSIPNAFMASTSPQHPFWTRPLDFVKENISVWKYNQQPEELTGPVALRTCVNEWQEETDVLNGAGEYDEVRVIEHGKIYPFTWNDSPLSVQCVCDPRNPTFDSNRCHQIYPDAWTITYWTHSWG